MKFYYMDKGQAFLVSETDQKEIEKCMRGNLPVNTHGRTLYPIYDDPSEEDIAKGKTTRVAFVIHDGGFPVARWYWQVSEHKRALPNGYKALGDGLCASKMVRCMTWNSETKKWELLPMVNHATPEQEQVLDTY